MIHSGSGRSGRRGPWGRSDHGAAAVEMALIMPVLLMLICAIIDFGRMYNAQITLTQAAREGARAAAYSQTTAQIQARVNLAASGLPTSPTLVGAPKTCPNATDYAEVDLRYGFQFVTPLAVFMGMFGTTPSGNYTLTSKAVVTCSG